MTSPAAAQTLDLTRARVPGGGGVSVGGQFTLFSTVGQAEASPRTTGGTFALQTGFLGAALPSEVPSVFFPEATVTVLEDAGPQTRPTFPVFEPGIAGEPAEPASYQLSNNNLALFSAPPAIGTNRTLAFTPAPHANGIATVTVVVRADGVAVATNTFTITVTPVNDAPAVTLSSVVTVLEDAGAQSLGSFAAFSPGPSDEASQTATYSLTTDNDALFSALPAIATDGTLTFTPATNANGSATVTVITVDGGGTANGGLDRTTNYFTLAVTAVNDPPAAAYSTNHVIVLEDAGAQTFASFAAFTAGPADESAQTPTYALTADNPALFSVPPAIAANGTLTFTSAPDANGSATITVILADSGGTAGGGVDRRTNSFQISVTAVNDPGMATFALNNVVALEDAGAQSLAAFATFTAGPADEAGQAPAYSLTANNPALFASQPAIAADGTLTFTPAANANGAATVTVTVADDGGTANNGADRSTNSFTITVTAVNDPPTVAYLTNNFVVLEDAGARSVPGFAVLTPGPADESAQTATYSLTTDNAALFSELPALAPDGTLTFTTPTNASGVATVTVVVQDSGGTANGGGDRNTNTFTITVTAVNDAPSVIFATNQVVAVKDTGAQTVVGFATFSAGPADEAAQTPTYALTSDNAALFSTPPAIAANGTLTFTPATGGEGAATVTVVVQDSGGTDDGGSDKATNTFLLTVVPFSTAPDSYSVSEDQLLTVPATVGVLANDVGVGLGVRLVDAATNGTVTLNADGSFSYRAATNFNGTDTFTYQATNSVVASLPTAVTLTVTAVNDAPSVTFAQGTVTVLEDSGASTTTSFAAFTAGPANEVAQILEGYTVTVDNAGLFSAVPAINNAGVLTFTPATNANGSATVTVVVRDNGGTADGGSDRSTNTFTLAITAVNDLPAMAFLTNEVVVLEDAGAQSLAGFAAFVSGPANESAQTLLGYTVSNSSNALFSVQPAMDDAGQLTFTPATNAYGSATVTVVGQDSGGVGNGGVDRTTNTFTVTLTPVNDPPAVSYLTNTVVVLEDAGAQSFTGFVTFSAGPTNESAQSLVGYALSNSSNALFSVQPAISDTGVLTFTPATNANGSATVTVVVRDNGGVMEGGVDRSTNTFTTMVSAVNDAPVVTLAGAVTVLEDAGAQSRSGFVTSFNPGPADEAGQAPTHHVANDNAALFSTPPAIASDGTLTFTPTPNANGTATVTVVTSDGDGTVGGGTDRTTNSFLLTVTPVNDAPSVTFAQGTVTVLEDSGANTTAGFAAFSAGPANEVTQTLVGYTVTVDNAGLFSAVPAINNAGVLSFTPATNVNGSATVTVVVQDNGGTADGESDRSTNTFTIAVTPVNDAPSVAFAQGTVTVLEDSGSHTVTSFAAFTAGPANEVAQTLVGYTVTVDNAGLFSAVPAINNAGVLSFTPATNANGSATVTVVVQDNGGTADGGSDRSTNTFTIVVTPVNDAPSVAFAQGTVTVLEDAGAQSVSSFATFSPGPANESAQTLVGYTLTTDNAALFGTAPAINNAGGLTFTPALNANGSATVTVVVKDNGGTGLDPVGLAPSPSSGSDKSTKTFTIVVTSVNDAPVAVQDNYTMSQGDGLTVAAAGVLANDTDVENHSLTATKLTNPAHGSATLNANGGFTYTPNPNFYGPDSFTYRASDASSNSNPATVSILVYARPTNTVPVAQNVASSVALRFSGTNTPLANAIRVGDLDSTELTVSLAVTNGSVRVTVTNGLAFATDTNSTNVVMTGPLASLNAALESLAYTSTTNYFGDDTLVVVTTDEGGRTNRGGSMVAIVVEIPTLGGVPQVSLDSLNNPTTGRMITNVTAMAVTNLATMTADTNLVQSITFDPTNNVVNVLPVGGQDGLTNRANLTVLVRFNDGTTQLVNVPVIIYQPLLAATTNNSTYNSTFGTPLFNLQTSLYEQKVRVQNNTPFDFTALRISATNLPATVTLQNATITNGGVPYIDYNVTVVAGSNVTLKLEYFSSDLRTFTPGLKLELLNQQRTNSAPPGAVMTSVALRTGYSPDGATKFYLYFPSTAGQRYYVQYQDVAGPVWKTSGVVIPGTGYIIHWLDDGPPSTDTPSGAMRFYRLFTDR